MGVEVPSGCTGAGNNVDHSPPPLATRDLCFPYDLTVWAGTTLILPLRPSESDDVYYADHNPEDSLITYRHDKFNSIQNVIQYARYSSTWLPS